MSKVWLVTGGGRGLGRNIVEAALAGGNRVVATARKPQALSNLVTRFPNQVRAVALDVTDPAAARNAVQAAVDGFGGLDVLVNNAGFGHLAPFEQNDEDDFRTQIDANFYGVVNVTRAALPVIRRQRSGHILQISSVGGRMGTPGLAAYQAAKWAVGGFSEVLAQEVGALGIKVCVLEPGGMRTGWAEEAGSVVPEVWPDYQPSVGPIVELLSQYAGQENSDPAKVAQVVLMLANHDNPPLHLLLGSDALHFAGQVDRARAAAGEDWREVSLSVDFKAGGMIPDLDGASS
jgi:NAD(P)-dependent dehydrogenase (short-subunit alcohol dehydrogenase family)